MKNKKGFTLIEIIVSLTLIALIATISIVLISKNNKQKYSKITNKIIRAASVYIATEKDDNGNTYEYGITHGAKGAQISVKTLYDKGYIDESTLKTLETNYKIEGDKTYLIQVTNSIKTNDDAECKSSGLNYTVNWEKTSDTVYLCPYDEIKVTETASFYDLQKCPNDNNATNKFCYYSDDKKYYYVDKVDNNYVSFGKDGDTNALWRVLYIDKENNEVKLVYNDKISSGNDIYNCTYNQESNLFTGRKGYVSGKNYYKYENYLAKLREITAPEDAIWERDNYNLYYDFRTRFMSFDCDYTINENSQISIICKSNDDDSYTNMYGETIHYKYSKNSGICQSEFFNYYDDKIEINCNDFYTYVYKNNKIKDELIISKTFYFINPLYEYYYKPLQNFLKDLKLNESKLIKEHTYKINDSISLKTKVAVPDDSEYNKFSTAWFYNGKQYSDKNPVAYFYGDENHTMYASNSLTPEITNNFVTINGNSLSIGHVYCRENYHFNDAYLRPVVVLDLKNLNLSNGDGTKENPYTIE